MEFPLLKYSARVELPVGVSASLEIRSQVTIMNNQTRVRDMYFFKQGRLVRTSASVQRIIRSERYENARETSVK